MTKAITVQNSPTPTTLLEKAIEKGVDISQLKELMDLQERWERKEAKKAFFEALSKFQTLVPVLGKSKTANINSRTGNNYSYNYATLGSITNDIKKALNICGLSYRWEFKEEGIKMKVTCIVSHKDGHSETSAMEAGKDDSGGKNTIQQIGSTQTYLQRYTLIGALGLSTADVDNDGKAIVQKKAAKEPVKEQTEEEALSQWQDAVNQSKTKLELKALYLKNKKVVEGNEKIQAIFKAREAKLKETISANPSTVMP